MAERYALGSIGDERTARIALSYAVPVGHALTGQILDRHGAVEALKFALGDEPPGVDRAAVRVWRSYFEGYDPEQVARGVDLAKQHGLVSLIPGDSGWPIGIDDLREQAPAVLWARGGRPELLNRPLWERVTIAGSRAAVFGGLWDSQQLAVGLASRDITMVASSLLGVPRKALAGTLGSSSGAVAVFSSGLDNLYPGTPNGFFDSIAEQGVLLSETPPGVGPSRASLQGASRIVAALSAVTTVVESGPRGLAMDTATHAWNLRRLVAAVRGPEDEIGNLGSNMLLDRGIATPVMDRDDVLAALRSFREKGEPVGAANGPLREAQSATPEAFQRSADVRMPGLAR